MPTTPYVGITGFTARKEVEYLLTLLPKNLKRKIMVGVLCSFKSLRGIPLKPLWQKRFVQPEKIEDVFLEDSRLLNLVHYSTSEGKEDSILDDMIEIHNLAGPNFHGFQLNIAWPEIYQLEKYRLTVGKNYRVVLQIGEKAMEKIGWNHEELAERVSDYKNLITDILFDLSGGQGKVFESKKALSFILAILEKNPEIGIGVAGGLGPDTIDEFVRPIAEKIPYLSIDAEGRLRNSENELDFNLVKRYLEKSFEIFNN